MYDSLRAKQQAELLTGVVERITFSAENDGYTNAFKKSFLYRFNPCQAVGYRHWSRKTHQDCHQQGERKLEIYQAQRKVNCLGKANQWA